MSLSIICSLLVWLDLSPWDGDWSSIQHQLCLYAKGKKPKSRVFKIILTEFVYAIWLDSHTFQQHRHDLNGILHEVVQKPVCRALLDKKLKSYCNSMLDYPRV